MFKSKISERVQEVILPDFPDDENTVPTVTKSRRVSFGTNFVKEFIVGSAVSGQCLPEYEQAFPSSDSSTADSSHSAAEIGVLEHSVFVPPPEIHKVHKPIPPVSQPVEPDFPESRPKLPKFSSTVCFSADSPTADMEFTEGCITLAKSILDKKNKEMTVIIQAKPKEPKDEETLKEGDTKYFDGSQFEMSMTRCLKSKGNKREEKKFECEKTKIFSKYENEMSITRCNRIFNEDDTDSSWEECKENRMPLDMIMRHLDKENSDLENDLFNPEKKFDNFFNADALDLTNESEKLNLDESMDISTDFQARAPRNVSLHAAEFPGRKSTVPVVEKSLVGVLVDDRIDKSTDDLSLDEGHPFERIPSPLDYKMNKSVLQESKVLVPTVEQSVEIPPIVADDRIDTSTQQLSLALCVQPPLPEKELLVVASTVTDLKVIALTESEKVVACERESMVLVLPSTDKISEAEEMSRIEQPTKRMSLDRSNVVLTPEKGVAEELVIGESIKSPERMSLDGSNEVLPSEIVESPADTPNDQKLNKSARQSTLGGNGDILREESLMEVTCTDKLNESTEPKAVDMPSADHISVSVGPNVVDMSSTGNINVSIGPKVVNMSFADPINVSVGSKVIDLSSAAQRIVSEEPKIVNMSFADPINVSLGPKVVDLSSAVQKKVSEEPKIVNISFADSISVSVGPKMAEMPSADQMSVSKLADEPSADQMSVSKLVDEPSADQISVSVESKVVDMSSIDPVNVSVGPKVVDESSADQISVSLEPKVVELPPADKISESTEQMVVDQPPTETEQPPVPDKRISTESLDETEREPSLVDVKVIESLKEQSKEAGCVWSLKDLRHPQRKSQGFLSFNCKLLESSTGILFRLKMTNEDSPVACSFVTNSEINVIEENQLQLPEYQLVVDFGFGELKKHFEKHRTQVETIRHVPYFLDQINSFVVKMNRCLRQILSILTMYPGSRLEGSRLSFRLFSFPIFFSSTVSIDLSNYFRLSKSSLSFDTDLGSLDENKIRQIFEDCLKHENPLCEFIVQSTRHLIDLEKESGRVSKRGHIRLLPPELKL